MMGVVFTIIKVAVFVVVGYYVIKISHAVATQPNLRHYLAHTLKDLKNMYYRYHV